MTETNILEKAIVSLANACDGAHILDDMGFNRYDSSLGRQLAFKPFHLWTQNQKVLAHSMLAKYRKQLLNYGIIYSDIPIPESDTPSQNKSKMKSSISLSSDSKNFVIKFPYNISIVNAVRDIKGRRWNAKEKYWSVSNGFTESYVELLDFAKVHKFEIEPSVLKFISDKTKEVERQIESSKATDANIEIKGLGGELRPFQRAGVAYASKHKSVFISDDMGLGKTVQALATVQKTSSYPALILCPASLKYNWEREVQKWLPGKTVQVLSSKDILFDTDITILNYDIVKKHFDTLKARKYQTIIMDESHYLKSSKSIRTKLTSKLANKIPYKLALTGTPILNRPQELISQLGILGRLGDFGGYWNFSRRYCNATMSRWGWDLSGSSNLDELNLKLRSTCFIRRTKSEVLKELPAKQRVIIPVELSNNKEYEKAESDIISWIGEQAQNENEFLQSIEHLPQHEQIQLKRSEKRKATVKAESAEHLVRIEALKQITVQGKMKIAKDWVGSFLETGEKLIIFAHHVSIQKELLDMFPGSARIMAEDAPEIRQQNVDKFQDNSKCKIMIASLQAGGVGITLTAASNVLFLELGWNPATMSQAEDRCHRIGQTDSVTAYYMLGKDTIDEDIYELIEDKRSVIDEAIEDNQIRNTTKDKSILSSVTDRLIKKNV